MNETPRIVPASPDHAEAISALLQPYVPQGIVLPRPVEEIRRLHADFLVALLGDRVVGAVALRSFGAGLQEVRSLVVDPAYAGSGLGSRLVAAAVVAAAESGANRVFALTLRPRLFVRLGFRQVDMDLFPQKVWLDCAKCPKRDRCDEIALILQDEELLQFVRDHASESA